MGVKVIKQCEKCGNEFEDYISNKRSGYCSLSCYWRARKNNSRYSGYWTNKKRPDISGTNSKNWKGENISYRQLHSWVKKVKTKIGMCEHCHRYKNTDWANKSREYKRELNDWIELCRYCHIKYDKSFRGKAKEKYGHY